MGADFHAFPRVKDKSVAFCTIIRTSPDLMPFGWTAGKGIRPAQQSRACGNSDTGGQHCPPGTCHPQIQGRTGACRRDFRSTHSGRRAVRKLILTTRSYLTFLVACDSSRRTTSDTASDPACPLNPLKYAGLGSPRSHKSLPSPPPLTRADLALLPFLRIPGVEC